MPSSSSHRLSEYTHENGGRVLLLFLLFLLAIYEFVTAGFSAFATVCIIPVLIFCIYVAFRWRMSTFWALIIINFFVQMKDITLPIPVSLPNEMLQIILMAIAVIDIRQTSPFGRIGNLMFFALVIWCGFCLLEILNDTCNLGISIARWYNGARLMAFQLLYIFIVFSLYISTPETLRNYLILWALLSLFSAFWTWKQIYLGLTVKENVWLQTSGYRTHLLNAGTLLRYWSTFNDAACYGCYAAASSAAFIIFAITNKIKRFKLFFGIIAIAVIWGMFQSGTRTAIFCLAAGLLVYIFLSKSFKIAIPFTIIFGIFAFILMFTNIGNSNQQIRRMRSAFNKDDASASVREINQEVMKKHIKDAPWGIGLGMGMEHVPANNKYWRLATIPPDSEYVFIWLRTGPIGITIFVITMLIMLGGACRVVLFKLKNKSLIGIGGGLCGAFVASQLGGYGNQILMQMPNCLTFYGGLAIVYILPYLEPAWIEMENKMYERQEEKKRIKREKKLASRV